MITDIARLPDWNDAITSVNERPDQIDVGAQWVVGMHALGQRWPSRSMVEVADIAGRCFAYRSATDDGNPTYALWTWVVADHADGTLVTVACELHPRTFWRRVLFVRIRSRQLAGTELPLSKPQHSSRHVRERRPCVIHHGWLTMLRAVDCNVSADSLREE